MLLNEQNSLETNLKSRDEGEFAAVKDGAVRRLPSVKV
jgi:hypothetical protein